MNNRTIRMARTALCVALALGVAAPASAAVAVNPRGLGQVLLFPYYTVNNGNDTYVSLVNTTDRGKAVKLTFREARNGREVLSVNLYLSPYDVWTAAAISLDSRGPGNLLTRDSSCTVPAIRTNPALQTLADGTHYVPFRNFMYANANADNGGLSLTRSREGYLEVIEMGELRSGTAPTQVLDEVSHTSASAFPNSGTPTNCDLPIGNWDTVAGAWGGSSGNRQQDIDAPTGGLYGSAQIINVANGTLLAYVATAIDGFYGGTAPAGGLHTAPGATTPNLTSGSRGGATLESEVVTAAGDVLRSTWNAGTADAVSAVLMQDGLRNDFDIEDTIGATTEWVATFPTKFAYSGRGSMAAAPFSEPFVDDGMACEAIATSGRDRESLILNAPPPDCEPKCIETLPPPVPPPLDPAGALCYATSVVAIEQGLHAVDSLHVSPTRIFGSDGAIDLHPRSSALVVRAGVLNLLFKTETATGAPLHRLTSLEGDVYTGLPVLGFAASNFVNGNAQPGKLANYSAAIPHRGILRVERARPTAAAADAQ